MSKSNTQHLKDIISKLISGISEDAKKELVEEANEFIEAIDDEEKELLSKIDDLKDENKKLEEDKAELNSELENISEEDYENYEDFGLDTFSWSLGKGNLKIQEDVDNFISSMRQKYIQSV